MTSDATALKFPSTWPLFCSQPVEVTRACPPSRPRNAGTIVEVVIITSRSEAEHIYRGERGCIMGHDPSAITSYYRFAPTATELDTQWLPSYSYSDIMPDRVEADCEYIETPTFNYSQQCAIEADFSRLNLTGVPLPSYPEMGTYNLDLME
jgi:hypothetical protein